MHNEYFAEKIATLPESLQEAILASGWEKALSGIQKEFKLHIDQGQVLEDLAQRLMFGDIDAPDFVAGMFNEAHISSAVAGDILVEIDEKILRNIRMKMEEEDEMEARDEADANLALSDEELAEKEMADIYANYYAESARALADAQEELEAAGISPDGTEKIPDEKLAKALNMTVEEMNKKRKQFQQAIDTGTDFDIQREKDEIIRELESPKKTAPEPLFTMSRPKPVVEVPRIQPEVIIPPDHQLQNVHIETPYEYEEADAVETNPQPMVQIRKPLPEASAPVIKKPTKITLSIDPYREPLE